MQIVPTRVALPEGIPFAIAVTSVLLPHLLQILARGFPINMFSRPWSTQVPLDGSGLVYDREAKPLLTRAYYNGKGRPPQLPFVEWRNLDVGETCAPASLAKNIDLLQCPPAIRRHG